MKNILVTVDFEENANVLVETAATWAVKFSSKLWLVHIAAPEPDFIGYEVGPQYIRDVRAEELRKEHRLLQKWSDHLNQRGIETESLLISGATVEMILAECEKLDIDLVVIGHHKHGLLHKIFVGSTDLQVARKAKIPVLIVPLDD
jgi:nucleotide-binding universal stress UspA family protein